MLGYQNNVLRLDLSRKEYTTEPLNMSWARQYIGSKGLAIKYLYEELKANTDPLSADNKLILMTSPLTGTIVPCSGKLSITSKSPGTGTISDSSIGGHCALKIKYAGYDAVILEGKLPKPGYILINNDKVEFNDAAHLWGRSSHETEGILAAEYGHEASVLSIGRAGENLVSIACINTDYYRQAGRGGLGAVMGSKNVKAVVIIGTGGVKVHDIEKTTRRIIEILKEDCLSEDNSYIFDQGTTAFLEACSDGGILPYKNFRDTTDENLKKYDGDVLLAHRVAKKGCGSCALGCGNFLRIGNSICEGPEYETISASGSNAMVSDPEAILKANEIADDMGLDTISAGDIIAWAMEMTERGIHDFGIRFGDSAKFQEYLELLARREGVGAELALGVRELSKKYGGEDFAMHVKGLEYPQYEPRGSWGMALAYAVSDRGACHMRAYAPNEEVFAASIDPYTAKGKGRMVYELGNFNAVKFSLCLCDFWGTVGKSTMAELMTLITGTEWTEDDMTEVGDRVLNIARAFNQREGFDRKDDTIPKRLVNEALKTGAAAGQKISQEDFEDMLDQYYAIMGWEQNGMIPESRLKTL